MREWGNGRHRAAAGGRAQDNPAGKHRTGIRSGTGDAASTKKRGGRKPLTETCPQLVENFLEVLRDHTASDPMRADVKWTNLSRRQISRRLKTLGTPAGKNVVSSLLWEHGYCRRKPQKKRTPLRNGRRDNTPTATHRSKRSRN